VSYGFSASQSTYCTGCKSSSLLRLLGTCRTHSSPLPLYRQKVACLAAQLEACLEEVSGSNMGDMRRASMMTPCLRMAWNEGRWQ
jgi:hypothetical protein